MPPSTLRMVWRLVALGSTWRSDGDDFERRLPAADVGRVELEIRAVVERHVDLDAPVARRRVERENAAPTRLR